MTAEAIAHTRFSLPAELEASEPPEARGLARDGVRLLVADHAPESADGVRVRHARFRDLGEFLAPGDLLVVNTSATMAAAVDVLRRGGERAVAHFSTPLAGGAWVVEVRRCDGSGPVPDAVAGETLRLVDGGVLHLRAGYPDADALVGSRLWRADVDIDEPVETYLARHGRPITYRYVPGRWPLISYQTVFANESGSAEMPSAGRPFTRRLVTELVARGISIAPVVLHAGVSSLEPHEPPLPERYRVPAATARLVGVTRATGGRVIAVGTTATRAIETVATDEGLVREGGGWTNLVLGPDRPARVANGIVTGWHAPDASHLALLEAVVGPTVVQAAYDAALHEGYLWHEFGDTALLFAE